MGRKSAGASGRGGSRGGGNSSLRSNRKVTGFDEQQRTEAPAQRRSSVGAVSPRQQQHRREQQRVSASQQRLKERNKRKKTESEKLNLPPKRGRRYKEYPVTHGRVQVPVKMYKKMKLQLRVQKEELNTLRSTTRKLQARISISKPSHPRLLALNAAFHAQGVSARATPRLCAVVLNTYTDNSVTDDMLFSKTTAVRHRLIAGSAAKLATFDEINTCNWFSLGFDTSNRGGKIASITAATIADGELEDLIVAMPPCTDETGKGLLECLQEHALRPVTEHSKLVALTTDGPVTMTGVKNGLGALLSDSMRRWIMHQLCEQHGLATLSRTIKAVFPPAMGVPGISQYAYLLYFILNLSWELFRTVMYTALQGYEGVDSEEDNAVTELLEFGFGDGTTEERIALARTELSKPKEPNDVRWGTVVSTLLYIDRWLPLLQLALNRVRESPESGAQTGGSLANLCKEWLGWSYSNQMQACMYLVMGFIEQLIYPIQAELDQPCRYWGASSNHRIHSKPARALSIHMRLSESEAEIAAGTLKCLAQMKEAFPNDTGRDIVVSFYNIARTKFDDNYGRTFSGGYVYAGLGDPELCAVAFNAICTVVGEKKLALRLPADLKKKSKILAGRITKHNETQLKYPHHQELWNTITHEQYLKQARKFANKALALDLGPESQAGAEWVRQLQTSTTKFATLICSWQVASSHAQPTERAFNRRDYVMRFGGHQKKKQGQPVGPRQAPQLAEGAVLLGDKIAAAKRQVLAKREEPSKSGELRVGEINEVSKLQLQAFTLTPEMLKRATEEAKKSKEEWKRAKSEDGGEAPSHIEQNLMTKLERSLAHLTKKTMDRNLQQLRDWGSAIGVPVRLVCFLDTRCVKHGKPTKGRQPNKISCAACMREYHVKCVEAAGRNGGEEGEEDEEDEDEVDAPELRQGSWKCFACAEQTCIEEE